MLNVSGATRVFVALQPVDLRGSFNRLHSLVIEVLQEDPLSGHLFVFTNRRHNRVKAIFWDGYRNRQVMGRADCQRPIFQGGDERYSSHNFDTGTAITLPLDQSPRDPF